MSVNQIVAITFSHKKTYLDHTTRRKCGEDLREKKADCSGLGFGHVPQHLPGDIQGLHLERNNIKSLLNSSFTRYPLITQLNLSKNDIRIIESSAFQPLTYLDRLSFSSNPHLLFVGKGLLKWARELSYLDLSESRMRSIPNDILAWSSNVDTLNLKYNLLKVINISSCGTVKNVDLSRNKIKCLTKDAFHLPCNVGTLDLSNNPIRSVDPDVVKSLHIKSLILKLIGPRMNVQTLKKLFIGISRSEINTFIFFFHADLSSVPDLFDPLGNSSLAILDLSVNALRYPYNFTNLISVKQLKLRLNRYFSVEPSFFAGMHNLRELDMALNNLQHTNLWGIPWRIDLTHLDLSSNRLFQIKNITFNGLHKLQILKLNNNPIGEVDAESFLELESIETIDLSHTQIVIFRMVIPNLISLHLNDMTMEYDPTKCLKEVRSLQHLQMNNSALGIRNLWNSDKNISLFERLRNLTSLDLNRNNFSNSYHVEDILPPGILQPLSALKNLSLQDCELSNLHPEVFIGLKSLEVIFLSENKLEQLPAILFKKLNQITTIDLSDNILTELDRDIFVNNRRLGTLLISNNKLTRVDQNTFKPIHSSLFRIDLSNNPIDCNCDLSWFLDLLDKSLSLENEKRTLCQAASLEPLRGKRLIDFDPKEYCSINVIIICLPSLAIICLIFIIAIVYYNRWQLRYKVFLIKLAVIGYKEMRDARDHNDYEFDLNVIFYDDDEDWIREHLRPAVAERLPQFQRNVFGDDELVLGMHYLDSVDYVVSHSYKTVVILSRAAVRDRWFILKFRTAMDHVSDTQTEYVVVIFLEDIPDNEMPFLVRLYLSDGRPYIHWTEDIRGHEYFFEELTKHLTINLRTDDRIPIE
ncbi:toll-like receptor 3 [Lytechinus pictus]|uniref:toll-like receptor 3 n=1 Tax=Lytechinus pictus TaxID=7653 RepID=UPI0030B9C21E